MKAALHPEFHTDAVVTCVCGNTFLTGSTLRELKTEVCSVCHPFFTGTQRIVDTGGQVERFRRRAAARTVPASRRAARTRSRPSERRRHRVPLPRPAGRRGLAVAVDGSPLAFDWRARSDRRVRWAS